MSACVTCDQYDEMKKDKERAEGQVEMLAKFLMSHPVYSREVGKTDDLHGEGAIECAIRLLSQPPKVPTLTNQDERTNNYGANE